MEHGRAEAPADSSKGVVAMEMKFLVISLLLLTIIAIIEA